MGSHVERTASMVLRTARTSLRMRASERWWRSSRKATAAGSTMAAGVRRMISVGGVSASSFVALSVAIAVLGNCLAHTPRDPGNALLEVLALLFCPILHHANLLYLPFFPLSFLPTY